MTPESAAATALNGEPGIAVRAPPLPTLNTSISGGLIVAFPTNRVFPSQLKSSADANAKACVVGKGEPGTGVRVPSAAMLSITIELLEYTAAARNLPSGDTFICRIISPT